MNAGESFAGDFVDFIEVVKIGGCVIFTTVAIAVWIEWFEHFAIFGVANINAAIRCVEGAVAGLASGGDAVESITAVFCADKEIAWFGAHTEEMAWLIIWDDFIGKFNYIGCFSGFGSIEGADTVTVNGLPGHKFGGFAAEVFEKTTLNNSVKILFWFAGFFGFLGEALMLGNVARKPVMGANHGFSDEFFVG